VEHFNLGASQGLPNVQRFKEEFGARPAAYASLVHESRLWRGVKRLQEAMQGLRGGRPAGPGAGG
jgi:hypothetical protein